MEGIVHYKLLERNLTSLLNAIVNNFAVWRKQSSNSTVRFFHIHPTPRILPHRITTSSALSLSNNLHGDSFNNDAEQRNWLDDFFMAKSADFFKCGIENLPVGWEAVVNCGAEYIVYCSIFM
jgi:type IV secretory pathway VirB6-like protein